MNPSLLKYFVGLASSKQLFTIVLWTFIFVLSLPIIAVFVVANTGTEVASNALTKIDAVSHVIKVYNAAGEVVAEIQAESTWPLHGTVTLEFGASDLPYQPVHTGIDIAGAYGTPISPFMKGKVIEVGHLSWGYGNYVVVDNGNNITSLYGHMSKTLVGKGQEVKPGDVLGLEGSTGWSTGPHVHFEIKVFGIPVNPRTFLEGNP